MSYTMTIPVPVTPAPAETFVMVGKLASAAHCVNGMASQIAATAILGIFRR